MWFSELVIADDRGDFRRASQSKPSLTASDGRSSGSPGQPARRPTAKGAAMTRLHRPAAVRSAHQTADHIAYEDCLDLARMLNCDRRTIERMRSAGRLPHPDLRVGRPAARPAGDERPSTDGSEGGGRS